MRRKKEGTPLGITCWVIALGVARYAQRLLQIGIAIDVDMANALGMTQHGYVQRLLLNVAHQFRGATWYNQINVILHGQQIADLLASRNLPKGKWN